MIWDQLTSKQLSALDKNIPVFLNIAATEQHGAHLPVATDRLIGGHFLSLLNKELGDKILILPPVAVGCSDHHMEFIGSLTLSHNTFAAVVKELVQSVIHHGFKKIILLNSHGGNQGIMTVILEQLGFENPKTHILGATWWTLAKPELLQITETGFGGTGHACEFETSLMKVIAPELVNESLIAPGANVDTFDFAQGDMLTGGKVSYYRTMKTMTPNGVFGDPTKSSPEKGVLISNAVVKALKQLVKDVAELKDK